MQASTERQSCCSALIRFAGAPSWVRGPKRVFKFKRAMISVLTFFVLSLDGRGTSDKGTLGASTTELPLSYAATNRRGRNRTCDLPLFRRSNHRLRHRPEKLSL